MMALLVTILSNILVAGPIAVLAWLAGRSDRRPALAHLLWMVFFVKLVTPPLVPLPISLPHQWLEFFTLDQIWISPSWFVLGVWAGGFLYCLTRGVIRFLRFQRLVEREGLPDEEAGEFVASLIEADSPGKTSGRRRAPHVLRLPLRISPMLFGFGHRPVIVCPEALWKSLSEEESRAFLAHETAHYCRKDHWIRWLEFLVTAIYWWFPLVYIARRQLEHHEEACCDEWAVRMLKSSPRQYADSLLKVVDFISEHQVRFPRLASAMRPTTSLEMRLRLVMQIGKQPAESRSRRIGFAAAGVLLLLLHPFPEPRVFPVETATGVSPRENIRPRVFDLEPSSSENPERETPDLPPAPKGFWNEKPQRQWADVSLSLPGVKLKAHVMRGITIETSEGDSLRFSANSLRALVEIPGSRRVVIGSRDGSVRVWDLDAGTPVSLLGRHAQEITSLAYHENGGLISADAAGSVIRWDMQSGQVLATSSIPASSVQSIRFSADGRSLAVLTGRWNTTLEAQEFYLVESATLEPTQQRRLTERIALVEAASDDRWLSVDWSGNIRQLESKVRIGRIPKRQVSAMLLSQNIPLPTLITESQN